MGLQGVSVLSGTGDSQHDSRESLRANRFARIDSRESFAIETPMFIARQADSHESLDFWVICANRANRFARITPLSICMNSHFLRHSSPRASVECRLGPVSARFDLFDLALLFQVPVGCFSAGFALSSAGSRKRREKR